MRTDTDVREEPLAINSRAYASSGPALNGNPDTAKPQKTHRLADDQVFNNARLVLIKCPVATQSVDFGTANDGNRLSINPSTDQNLPVQFCKASSQTKCLIRIHYDIVFRVPTPNSRRMY